MIILENQHITIKIAALGAELKSVVDQMTNIEYLWQADPSYWGRSSPILFPIVGRLTDDTYYHEGETFHMSQHGLARDQLFECIEHTADRVCLRLESDRSTRQIYPFDFILDIIYTLVDNEVQVQWIVKNVMETQALPFSIGAHPAFNLHLFDADTIDDFYVAFDREIELQFWQLEQGCFGQRFVKYGKSDSLKLATELFSKDALVWKDNPIQRVSLKNMKNHHSITMDLTAFTYGAYTSSFALWTPYKDGGTAPFICLEPWFGYADTVGGPYELAEKPGVITLDALDTCHLGYSLKFT